MATHGTDAAMGRRQQHVQEFGRLFVGESGRQLALDELQLGRYPASAFAIIGDRAISATGAGAPPGYAHHNFTEQAAIVNLMKILQLARLAAVQAPTQSVGRKRPANPP